MIRPTFAACALGLTAAAPALHAQSAAPRTFVTRRGPDTLVVERIEHGADDAVTSRLTFRGGPGSPAGLRAVATFVSAPDARVRRATVEITPPGANAPTQRATEQFGDAPGDSVDVRVGDAPPQRVAAPAGALPFVNLAVASYETLLRRARALAGSGGSGRTVGIPIFLGPGAPVLTATVTRVGADSAVITIGGADLRLRVGAGDQVLGARVPAQGVVTEAADPRAAAPVGASTGAATGASTPPLSYAPPPGAPSAVEDVRERDEQRLAGVPGEALFRQIADTPGRRGIPRRPRSGV